MRLRQKINDSPLGQIINNSFPGKFVEGLSLMPMYIRNKIKFKNYHLQWEDQLYSTNSYFWIPIKSGVGNKTYVPRFFYKDFVANHECAEFKDGIIDIRWEITFSLALFLTSALTTYHGACFMSVYLNIWSFAIEYSTHFPRASRSIGLSFHLRLGSWMRA